MSASHLILRAILVSCALLIVSSTVQGQVEKDGVDQPDAETKEKSEQSPAPAKDDSILAMVVDSGITGMAFMGILALFSMVAGTISVERALNMRQKNIIPEDFVDGVRNACNDLHAKQNMLNEICSRTTGPAATVLSAGLARFGQPVVEVEKAMEDAAAREMGELRARIRPLAMVGNVAPLVGLLGTVVGMILAFHTASQAGLGKAELLAKGIYMALLTTAGGLSIAIPSMMLASFFGGRIEKFFRELDRCLVTVLPHLAGRGAPLVPTIASPVSNDSPAYEPAYEAPANMSPDLRVAAVSSADSVPTPTETVRESPANDEPPSLDAATNEAATNESSTSHVDAGVSTVPDTKKPTAKKPSAKKPSAKKPSAKKPSAKKPSSEQPPQDGRGPYARR